MKYLALVLTFIVTSASAQQSACCIRPVSEQNAELAMNANFASKHLEPAPFKLEKEKGQMITFKTEYGEDARAYRVTPDTQTLKVVFLFHEWWGLNDYIKQEAEKLQAALGNVTVYAVDLYDGKLATSIPEAQKYSSELSDTRARDIIHSLHKMVGDKAQIATMGWCMGGAWSLQAALMLGKQAKACVVYYGMPEQDINKLKTLNCDVLGIFGTKDQHINASVVSGFEINMKKAGKKLTVHRYNADHAFANPSNPKFNQEYTKDAYAKATAFLKARLK